MCGEGGLYSRYNNAIYVIFKGVKGLHGDSGLEKIFQTYSIKASFSSTFQLILPFTNP